MVNRRPVVGGCIVAGVVGLAALLAACNASLVSDYADQRTRLPDPFSTVQNTDLQPRFPEPTQASSAPSKGLRPASYYGEDPKGQLASAQVNGAQPAASGEGYELNFENAAVSTVAKVILGDILGANYTIDPRVQGTVTVASGRPVAKEDLVFVLENALRTSNSVLLHDSSGYRIIPATDAQGAAAARPPGDNVAGGYGITAVPLHYASAEAIFKLLDSFAIKTGMARADAGGNLIIVQGTGPERAAAVETITSFDVDWMRGQSVGIYPVQTTTPEEMITELEKIIASGENGMNRSLVTLQPVSRLNAVLVVSKKPNLLKEAATWISRLDKSTQAGAAVRVYRLRYGNAKQIALLLNDIFGDRSERGLNSAVNQIAPGAGLTSSSSGNRPGSLPGTQQQGGLISTSGGLGSGGGFTGFGNTSGTSSGTPGSTLGGLGSLGANRARTSGQPGAPGADTNEAPPPLVLPGVRVTADILNNALVIYANQENYRLIERTLAQLDRPQLQVAIHATIAEVTLNNDLQYGVQYYLQNNLGAANLLSNTASNGQNATNTGTQTTTTNLISNVATTVINQAVPGANLVLGPANNPRAILSALRTVTDVKVLSSPSLVVINNQVATLVVGDQVPITTQSATVLTNPITPLVSTINYRDTGVILEVSPRINANGNVILDVDQEISNIANNSNATSLTPTVSQRKVKSQISVASGQTVLLGGLISETQQRNRSGIPVLEEIPLIGDAFAQNGRSTVRTELIIFIQPQIIRDGIDAYKVAEELRSKLRGSVEAAFPPGPSLRKDPHFVR